MRALASFVFLVLLAEGASYAGLWWIAGERPRASALAAEQAQLADSEATKAKPSGAAADRRQPRHLALEAVHPYLGFLPVERAVHALDGGVTLNTDACFADDSPLFARSPDDVVVGITGGSVAVFFARDGRRVLAEELAASPRFAGRRFVFVVLAFGGFKQPQQLMALNYVLCLGGRLDVLVNLDGFNEIALHASQNATQGVFPPYPRDWLLRTGADSSASALLGEVAYFARMRRESAEGALRSPWRRSWTYRLAWKLGDRSLLQRMRDTEAELRAQSRSTDPSRVGPSFAGDPLELLVRVWRESSLQLDRLCRANGIEYYHFLQPNQYVAGTKQLSEEERADAFDPEHPYARAVPSGYARLVRGCEELAAQGVRCHDLTGVFADTSETIYVDDCCHVNALGNELMARAIARAILSYSS